MCTSHIIFGQVFVQIYSECQFEDWGANPTWRSWTHVNCTMTRRLLWILASWFYVKFPPTLIGLVSVLLGHETCDYETRLTNLHPVDIPIFLIITCHWPIMNISSVIKVKTLVLAHYMAMSVRPQIMLIGEPRMLINDMCWGCNLIFYKHLHFGDCYWGFLKPSLNRILRLKYGCHSKKMIE